MEGCLLTGECSSPSLIVGAQERHIVLEGSLEEVSIGKVEPTLEQIVFKHKAIVEASIKVVLFGFACLLTIDFLTCKAIVWVICNSLASNRKEALTPS